MKNKDGNNTTSFEKRKNKVYKTCSQRTIDPNYYNSVELAALLGFSVRWVVKWRNTGKIPGAYRIGRQWRFIKSIVDKCIASGKFEL